MEEKTNYLVHHGVKGMRWGVRHDPKPTGRRSVRGNIHRGMAAVYGLNEKTYNRMGNKTLAGMNANAKKRQLAKANSLDKTKQLKKAKTEYKSAKKESGITDKHKKAIKAGAAVVGAGLAAYGAYKLNGAVTQRAISQGGKKFVMSSLEKKSLKKAYINSVKQNIKTKGVDLVNKANFPKQYTDKATYYTYGKKFVLTPDERKLARKFYRATR